MASCLGDRKQVQNTQFDSHLTGIKKKFFVGLRKNTISHDKSFPRKWKQMRHVEKSLFGQNKDHCKF